MTTSGRIRRPNQDIDSVLSFPIVGRVKCGYKEDRGNGTKIPRSVDYFIPSGKYASMFTAAFGEKPKKIQVMFLSDDPGKVCREEYQYRDAIGRLWASGDGVAFNVWDPATEKYEEHIVVENDGFSKRIAAEVQSNKGWEVTLALTFLIPAVKGIAGVWKFTTKGGASSIPAIVEAFDSVKMIKGTAFGTIFDLTVEFAKSDKPGINSRYPVVNLIANNSPENLEIVQQSFMQAKAPMLLTGGQPADQNEEDQE